MSSQHPFVPSTSFEYPFEGSVKALLSLTPKDGSRVQCPEWIGGLLVEEYHKTNPHRDMDIAERCRGMRGDLSTLQVRRREDRGATGKSFYLIFDFFWGENESPWEALVYQWEVPNLIL